MVNPGKLLHKNGGHFLGNIPDDAFQLPLGGEHIVPLLREVAVALVDPLVFLNCPQVGRAQSGNLPLELPDPPRTGGNVLNLSPVGRRRAGGQAVGIPQLIDNLLFLHGGSDLFLLQQRTGPLHIQNVLVFLLGIPLGFGFGGFRIRPVLEHFLEGSVHGFRLSVIFLLALLQSGNFPG